MNSITGARLTQSAMTFGDGGLDLRFQICCTSREEIVARKVKAWYNSTMSSYALPEHFLSASWSWIQATQGTSVRWHFELSKAELHRDIVSEAAEEPQLSTAGP